MQTTIEIQEVERAKNELLLLSGIKDTYTLTNTMSKIKEIK